MHVVFICDCLVEVCVCVCVCVCMCYFLASSLQSSGCGACFLRVLILTSKPKSVQTCTLKIKHTNVQSIKFRSPYHAHSLHGKDLGVGLRVIQNSMLNHNGVTMVRFWQWCGIGLSALVSTITSDVPFVFSAVCLSRVSDNGGLWGSQRHTLASEGS